MLYHASMRQQGQEGEEGEEEKWVVYGLTEGLVGYSTVISTVISSVLKDARSQTLYRLLYRLETWATLPSSRHVCESSRHVCESSRHVCESTSPRSSAYYWSTSRPVGLP
jgi:hypothetical protein